MRESIDKKDEVLDVLVKKAIEWTEHIAPDDPHVKDSEVYKDLYRLFNKAYELGKN